MLKVVFMGTPEFAVPSLKATHEICEILSVYCQPDKPKGRGLKLQKPEVKIAAESLGLQVNQPEKLSDSEAFEKLKSQKPDLIVVVAYGKLLKKEVLDLPKYGCINVHPSLLPRWRGAAPLQWPILKGDEQTGTTIMKLVEELDAGDIYAQTKRVLNGSETTSDLHDDLSKKSADLLKNVIHLIESGDAIASPQDETLVTYAHKLTKEMGFLTGNDPAIDLDRKVRALTPWPGTSVLLSDGRRLKIKKTKPHPEVKVTPNEIIFKAGSLFLGTVEGSLELLELQWEGKKSMNVSEFFNGFQTSKEQFVLKLKEE
ncbi:MAG: methionyl-tRNA formyltransferase [Bdellovibrionaceae bacterium]|nr:methionyl-tRNA formyltransferase [Pseudobdellovibrionaceae bacterium]|tara:strand:- start:1386 stop:2327 length:942 start_codon:yes stop_codon:yes gene_type:complete